MKTSITKVLLSLTCVLGLTACGGLMKVQRAVEAKGYEVEKVGVSSASGQGRTLTVYTEDTLDSAQKQEVVETAKEVYPKAETVKVVKGDGSGVGSSSGSSESRPNTGPKSKPNQ
ncbi:hypothetical protein ENSA5_12860 [Enhygromyxa salina]|uniref:Lipoprotein n=1 Tax=Enhygromyxa salina TaxID=215803 RepID=A0A2S9YFE4_9BACT|nr:hypothetical protein [Enhygromyxa salina]PRQ03736.1 hypothetical protein ENSA5_12860 [Enhygromyxa salina]